MSMERFAPLVLVLAGLWGLSYTAPARAQEHEMMHQERRRTVTVSGEGTASAMPDQATVRFGVVTIADDPEAAREQNGEAASQAMNAVRELGVPEENIQLAMLRLHPQYEYPDGERKLIGYEAVREVVVEVEDLELLPTLVAQVVQEGANRLEGVEYELEDRDAVRAEALREAVLDARDKARLLAQTLDAEMGSVLHINEQDYRAPHPMARFSSMAMAQQEGAADAAPDAFAPGEVEVSATVQVTFELQ